MNAKDEDRIREIVREEVASAIKAAEKARMDRVLAKVRADAHHEVTPR